MLKELGIDISESRSKILQKVKKILHLHMQMNYKQSIEVAEEEVINQVLAKNKYDLIRRRLNYDLTVLGISVLKLVGIDLKVLV